MPRVNGGVQNLEKPVLGIKVCTCFKPAHAEGICALPTGLNLNTNGQLDTLNTRQTRVIGEVFKLPRSDSIGPKRKKKNVMAKERKIFDMSKTSASVKRLHRQM